MNRHPTTGLPAGDGTRRCTDCAWAEPHPDGRRCVAAAPPDAPGPLLPADAQACAWWEPPVSCDPCGACCREAFDAVPVEPDDPTVDRHPDLILRAEDGWMHLRRVPSGARTRCACLRGDGERAPFRCTIYADRPTACRDLAPGTWNCRFARTRVGLSPR
jgi:hypothetical protein